MRKGESERFAFAEKKRSMSHVSGSGSGECEISTDSARLLEEIFKETGFGSYASDSNLLRLKSDIDDQHNTVSI